MTGRERVEVFVRKIAAEYTRQTGDRLDMDVLRTMRDALKQKPPNTTTLLDRMHEVYGDLASSGQHTRAAVVNEAALAIEALETSRDWDAAKRKRSGTMTHQSKTLLTAMTKAAQREVPDVTAEAVQAALGVLWEAYRTDPYPAATVRALRLILVIEDIAHPAGKPPPGGPDLEPAA